MGPRTARSAASGYAPGRSRGPDESAPVATVAGVDRTRTAADLDAALHALADPDAAVGMQRFFQTGPGGYGEGDRFLGLMVPQVKATLRPFQDLPPAELETLLNSPWHEVRTAALEIMAHQARLARTPDERRRELFDLYLRRHDRITNWDLVDRAARDVVGRWLLAHPDGGATLDRLAASASLWERRTAMVATMAYADAGQVAEVLRVAALLVNDPHDLIHKAVGWLLRCAGDAEPPALLAFLDTHAATMPRTALRYALEHLPDDVRRHYRELRASSVSTSPGIRTSPSRATRKPTMPTTHAVVSAP